MAGRGGALAAPKREVGDELAQERAARRQAEAAAERMAAAVAKEHTLRVRAEREAAEAYRELELVRTHRELTAGQPIGRGRSRYLWRRIRHALRS